MCTILCGFSMLWIGMTYTMQPILAKLCERPQAQFIRVSGSEPADIIEKKGDRERKIQMMTL